MSWHYLQGQEAESWEGNSLAGAPSALLRLMPTVEKSCSQDSVTASSNRSQSGTTFKPSTGDSGEGESTLSAEDSPARTLARQEVEKESKGSEAVCGLTWRESLVRYCHDSYSWKTHLCLWEEDLPWSSVILPRWGMMRDGVCWERITPALPTSETVSGSWPTPLASDYKGAVSAERAAESSRGVSLSEEVVRRATFATPCAADGAKGGRGDLYGQIFNSGRQRIPTPTAGDAKQSGSRNTENSKAHPGLSLTDYVKQDNGAGRRRYATPKATPSGPDYARAGRKKSGGDDLQTQVSREEPGGLLNPPWVEWLMGWPIGMTALDPLTTDKFRQWLSMHGGL